MYRHWAELCLSQEEWSAAAEAAERGLDTEGLGPSIWLSYLAGRSRYYLSKDLLVQAQYDRARQETLRAESHLQRALVDPVGLSPFQYRLHGRAYRTMALNYEQLILVGRQLGRFRPADREERRLLGSLRGFLSRWRSEHPDDGDVSTEEDRLRARFPGLYVVPTSCFVWIALSLLECLSHLGQNPPGAVVLENSQLPLSKRLSRTSAARAVGVAMPSIPRSVPLS